MEQDPTPQIFLNGVLCPLAEAHISVRDYGFLYGMGVFETMRFYPGHGILARDAHLERLFHGTQTLGLSLPFTAEALTEGIRAVLRANGMTQDASVKLMVSAGPGPLRPDPSRCESPTVVIFVSPYTPTQRDFSAVTAPMPHTEHSVVPRIKSLNYLPYLLARQQAKRVSADEVLFIEHEGFLCEGSTSNLFFVRDGRLHTPETSLPLLDGITRRGVLQVAHEAGISVATGAYTVEDLLAADEAFLTNSLMEIIPLLSVDAQPISTGKMTQQLHRRYQLKVERDAQL